MRRHYHGDRDDQRTLVNNCECLVLCDNRQILLTSYLIAISALVPMHANTDFQTAINRSKVPRRPQSCPPELSDVHEVYPHPTLLELQTGTEDINWLGYLQLTCPFLLSKTN
jgi:hypothetical protein